MPRHMSHDKLFKLFKWESKINLTDEHNKVIINNLTPSNICRPITVWVVRNTQDGTFTLFSFSTDTYLGNMYVTFMYVVHFCFGSFRH